MLKLFRNRTWSILLMLALSLMLLGHAARAVQAAPDAPNLDLPLPNIKVDTTALTDDPGDGKCDLWEALQAVFQANYGLSPTYHECTAKVGAMNIIYFSVVGGTITVPAVGPRTDLPFVHGETVILGPITIAGSGSAADTHLLRLAPGAKLTVIATVLKNGHTSGGGPAIYNDNSASVNLIASFLVNNTADNDGGAIYSNGDLNLIGTSFINNQAKGIAATGVGGAIYMTGNGSFKSEASTFTNNQAVVGGAIYLEKPGGEASISESIFTANGVSGDADGFGGGAVANGSTGGTLEINRSAFNANYSTQGAGGAIVNKSAATTYISNTLFDANIAGDPTHARNAGGIYNQGTLSIVKSTLVGNYAQGGSGGGLTSESNGNVTIANSTFYGNLADAQGGALYATANTTIAIRNSTFSVNTANGSGSFVYRGGTAQVQIGNSILERGAGLGLCSGTLSSLGHNLATDSSCGLAGSGDLISPITLLGPLGFHGGSLPVLTTQVPDYASLAVDHGDPLICSHPSVDNEDETGSKRPKDANNSGTFVCDIGAVEVDARKPAFDAEPMPPGPINFGSVEVNHTLTTTFTVHNAGNFTLTLSNPTLSNAHYGIVTFPTGLDVNQTKTVVLSCTPTAVGSLPLATFSFNTTDADKPSVAYTLWCNGTAAPAPSFGSLPVAPGPIEFGEVTIGQMVTQFITIKNNGTAQLTLNTIGNFFLSDGNNFAHNFVSPMNIAPGASNQIAVRCQPNRVGALSGSIQFSHNDSPQLGALYTMSCYGVPPQSAYLVNSANLKNPWLPSDFTSLFGVATSPDGLNAYVTGNVPSGGEIVVLKKATSGLLAGSYLWTTQAANVLLGNPHEVKVSPDGQYVLATGGVDNLLAEYSRDSGSGDLTPIYSPSNVGGLNNPFGVAFSPDSQFVYVTNSNGNSISIFKHIGSAFFYTGGISATTMTTHTLTNPTGIVVSPDGKHVYVAVHTNTASAGTLAVYRRNTTTGALTPIQTRYQGDNQDNPGCIFCFPVNGLASTYQLAISPDGGNVYVTSWYNHAVANFRRDALTGLLVYQGASGNSNIGGSGLTNAFGIAVSPDNKHVYATSHGDNSLVMFDREATNGYLSFRELYQRDPGGTPALGGAFQTAVSSDGGYVFAVGQTDNAVPIFRIANPVPTLFSLLPASVAQGSAQFTLIVKGSGFVKGAQVWWDGAHPTDTFINSSEMRATIPAAYVASVGNHVIKIKNPAPGGGDSFNMLTFKVLAPATPPVPSIDHISPAGVLAGAAGVQVDVYGSNFDQSGLTVTANSYGVIHQFIDSTHIRLSAFNVDTFAQPGTVSIQVNNYGVQSNIVGLNVAAPGQNPVPSITSLSPDWAWSLGAGSPEFTLTITGTNFVDGAVVQWNGSDRPTKFISKTKVQATISGSDQIDPANNSVIVKNPTPGGGNSNVQTFIVRALYQLLVPLVRN